MKLIQRRFLAGIVTVEPFKTLDDYGYATYSPATTYDGREIRGNELIRDLEGEETVSSARVYLKNTYSPDRKDRITLSDGSQPKILNIAESKDHDGSTFAWRVDLE